MKTFDRIEDAMDFAVQELMVEGHQYIVNVLSPQDAAANRASTIQVVAEHMIYENRQLGLTVHLPFDPSSGESSHLVEFLGDSYAELCDEYKRDGIPCYALRLSHQADLAAKIVRHLLVKVFGCKEDDAFKCEVHDEGELEDDPDAEPLPEMKPSLRDPEEIRQTSAQKLSEVQYSMFFGAMLGYLLGECWTKPRLVEMVKRADGQLFGRLEGEEEFTVACHSVDELLQNIHGVAKVANLDENELNYLVAKVAQIKKRKKPKV